MNIFKQLKRGNTREEEYFSSSLAIILEVIPELTNFIINEILKNKIKLNGYEIVLENSFEEGRFDIVIKSMPIEIYIENKVSAELGRDQLQRYSKYLKNITNNAYLILLTRDYIEDESIRKCADQYVFWSQLYEITERFLNKNLNVLGSEKVYLIKEFLEFLKEENMSNEKVTWEYTEGLKSFLNLLNIIQSVLDQLRKEDVIKTVSKKSIGQDYAGFYFNASNYWVGIYYSDPEKIFLELPKNSEFVNGSHNFKDKSPPGWPSKIYDFNGTYFFAFSKEEQKKAVYNFIKDSLIFSKKA